MAQAKPTYQMSDPYPWTLSSILPLIPAALVALALLTRLITGLQTDAPGTGSSRPPPRVPYWIPFLGSYPQFLLNPVRVLQDARKAFPTGIFTLTLIRRKYHIIASSSLAGAFLTDDPRGENYAARTSFLVSTFGLRPADAAAYEDALSALDETLFPHATLGPLTKPLTRALQERLPDILTFNPQLIDQEPWERLSGIELDDDRNVAEVSLFPLLTVFLTHLVTDTLLTPTLLAQQPDIAPLLTTLTAALPPTPLHPALRPNPSRRTLLSHLHTLHADLLTDAEALNPTLAARHALLPHPSMRVADTAALLTAFHARHVLAFWLLLNLHASPPLLAKVRAEIRKAVKATQPEQLMGYATPPRLVIDADALSWCAVLRAAWTETTRVYGRGWHVKQLKRDSAVQTRRETALRPGSEWALGQGESVHVPCGLVNSDPAWWTDPGRWLVKRFLVPMEEDHMLYVVGVRGEAGVYSMGEEEVGEMLGLEFVAGFLALYELEGVGGDAVMVPDAVEAAGVALPAGDVRVLIRRRELEVETLEKEGEKEE
ncbi:cytochrome P450 [Trichodelitschia bisporula]|uniref:Cytochrome P450 n=1 Tax=Trichodelitschia bisporula TaxID=703511 RepID=A0A6G1I8G6_9PEZI|nr:cytochrome P450 [Trichodelitschia bisporula]